ncbi:hypothetical protein F7725_002933 [Dissostichus mawsoni]|uniref:Uncharacterized protein n=1 Tax=Dissostichus mawsoni TaxID=36200 RepID=A0A7J5Y8W1_DISMA|nr:hypothetical protein F7725_002933 [Dissostichus mawsoni]
MVVCGSLLLGYQASVWTRSPPTVCVEVLLLGRQPSAQDRRDPLVVLAVQLASLFGKRPAACGARRPGRQLSGRWKRRRDPDTALFDEDVLRSAAEAQLASIAAVDAEVEEEEEETTFPSTTSSITTIVFVMVLEVEEEEEVLTLQRTPEPPPAASHLLLVSPSSNLLYSAISISRRVLMSSSIWYSCPCLSRSALSCISCSSMLLTCTGNENDRKISSSLRPSICISRSVRLMVSSSRTLFRPAVSASTDIRMASSFSYLHRMTL